MTKNKQDIILIVDDNPTNLGLLFDYLRGQGYRVLIAESGENALKAVQHTVPDIVLLDVMMPGMDGYETCERLKADPTTADIPIIFLTALSETVSKVKAFELGAADYVTKPIQSEEMLARINTHLTLRKLQKSLQQQIKMRDELITELNAFAHTVAHDLKTPLNALVGFSDYLLTYYTDINNEELESLLIKIKQGGKKMENIITELLLLASVRREEIKRHPLDMATIVHHAQQRLLMMIEESEGKIIMPSEWPAAQGHGPWVEEVWVNYLSNGLKYGGRPPELELGAQRVDGMVRFWVRDNGPGLSDVAQAKLFNEFTRLDKVRVQGHGLGLWIVQRIINKLGGEVGVRSELGQGAEFYFLLPLVDETG